MFQPGVSRLNQWDPQKVSNSGDLLRKIYGKPMGNPWETHGKPMGNPWETHGKPMGNPSINSQGVKVSPG